MVLEKIPTFEEVKNYVNGDISPNSVTTDTADLGSGTIGTDATQPDEIPTFSQVSSAATNIYYQQSQPPVNADGEIWFEKVDGSLSPFDVNTGNQPMHSTYNPDDNLFHVLDSDSNVWTYDDETGERIWYDNSRSNYATYYSDIMYSPEHGTVASIARNGAEIHVYNASDGTKLNSFSADTVAAGTVRCYGGLEYSPTDGIFTYMTQADDNGTNHYIGIDASDGTKAWNTSDSAPYGSDTSGLLIDGEFHFPMDGATNILDPANGSILRTETPDYYSGQPAYLPEIDGIAFKESNRKIRIVNASDYTKQVDSEYTTDYNDTHFGWNPENGILSTQTENGGQKFMDVETGNFQGFGIGKGVAINIGPDTMVGLDANSSQFYALDVPSGGQKWTVSADTSQVNDVAGVPSYSPRTNVIAFMDEDTNRVLGLDADTGEVAGEYTNPSYSEIHVSEGGSWFPG